MITENKKAAANENIIILSFAAVLYKNIIWC